MYIMRHFEDIEVDRRSLENRAGSGGGGLGRACEKDDDGKMSILWQLVKQENDPWIVEWDTSINPVKPDYFTYAKLSDGIEIACGGQPYAGALIKNVAPLVYPSTQIGATCLVKFGSSLTACGQVIEIDRKITDASGWTYDGSYQINVAEGWAEQIGNPWVNTGEKVALVADAWNTVEVNYQIDYEKHTITVAGSAPIAAKQVGWAPNQVVTQLQLCTSQTGFYTCKFSSIGLVGSNG